MIPEQGTFFTRVNMQTYALIFYAVVAVCMLAAALLAARVGWHAVLAVGGILITPALIGGPSHPLFFAPEYWLGEYVYLTLSAALFAIPLPPTIAVAALIGCWIGIGASLKITLVFAGALVFVYRFQKNFFLGALVAAVCAILAYCSLLIAYAGFRPGVALSMLIFQGQFFIQPNPSIQYTSYLAPLLNNPVLSVTLALSTLYGTALLFRRPLVGLVALAWLAVYAYLVFKRPHDSSVASAAISCIFFAFFLPVWLDKRLLAITAAGVIAAGAGANWPNIHYIRSLDYYSPTKTDNAVADRVSAEMMSGPGILFLPNNYWNVQFIPQAFLYNGRLGLSPPMLVNGIPHYPSLKAAGIHFPGLVLMGASDSELAMMSESKVPVYWTRRIANGDDPLSEPLARALEGRDIRIEIIKHHGSEWEYGVASPKPPSD